MKKPEPFLKKIIFKPEDFKAPKAKINFGEEEREIDTKIVGAFNPGVTTLTENELEKTLFMVRIAVEPIVPEDLEDKVVLLPYFDIKNKENSKFEIRCDVVYKDRIPKINKKEVELFNGTYRLKHISYPIIAKSSDGINIDFIEDKPSFYPCYEHERFGIEDIRITKLFDGNYVITYVCPHRNQGVSTSFAITKDFKKFERLPFGNTPRPIIVGVKDVTLFPEKIDNPNVNENDYAALTRPNSFDKTCKPGIEVIYSPCSFNKDDNRYLTYWGYQHRILRSECGEFTGTGSGVVKLKKEDVWFGVYHEVKVKDDESCIYRGSLFGLDLEEPWKLKHRSNILLEPNDFGTEGYVSNVVYPTGLIIKDNTAVIYSGENDSYVSARKYKLDELVDFLKRK